MAKGIAIIFFYFSISGLLYGQQLSPAFSDTIPTVIDSSYREDQFYFGLTFNFITHKPSYIDQNGFSAGFHGGFIRDFPLNQRRNVAIGAGIGLAFDSYGQNLFIGEDQEGASIFRNLSQDYIEYDSNRFNTYVLEFPVELRWRTSTFDSYKFWRVYAGLKLGYLYHFRSVFKQPGNTVRQSDVPELERFRLGATFTFGYNTFNFQVYYGLNPFFNDTVVESEPVEFSTLKVGLMFYIL